MDKLGVMIEIINWDEYQPRKDVKKPSWFRFDHDLISSDQFYSFSAEEFKAWIYILSTASQHSSGRVFVNFDRANRLCRVKKQALESAIKKLESLQVIHVDVTDAVRASDVDVREPHATLHNNTLHNITSHNTTVCVSSDSLKECLSEWTKTLEHFEIKRPISPQDEIEIARALQRFTPEWVRLALQGARKQTKSPRFDPKQFVSLRAYLSPDKIERLVNIGSGKESGEGVDWSKVFGGTK